MSVITQEQGEQVLAAVKARHGVADGDEWGPKLVMEFDYIGTGAAPTIVWEEGPDEWAYRFVMGGVSEELATELADVIGKEATREQVKGGFASEKPAAAPEGVHLECMTSWAVSIYPDN